MADYISLFLTFVLLVLIVLLAATAARIMIHLAYSLRASVFERSTKERIQSILKLSNPAPQDNIVDLGAGDGELLITFAKKGFKITGLELNPLLVDKARKRVEQLGLEDLVTIKQQNFLKADLSKYDLVLVYCQQHVMKKLEKKLKTELKPGARVVSNYFHFPNWEPNKIENEVRLYSAEKTAY